MKNLRMKHMVLLGAVLSAVAAVPAFADTTGVDSILEAAAGSKTPITVSSTKKPVTATPTPLHPMAAMPAPKTAVNATSVPKDMLVGPVPHVTVPAKPLAPAPAATSFQPKPIVPPAAASTTTMPLPVTAPRNVTPESVTALRPSLPAAPSNLESRNAEVTAGFVNPFMGAPSTEQELSSTLGIIKLKTEIAKEKATYAKYDSEADSLSMSDSPQLQKLEETVEDLRGKMQSLAAANARAQQVSQEINVQKAKAKSHFKVIAIINDQGKRSAIIQAGKLTKTVSIGSTFNGHLVQAINTHHVILADGETLTLSQQVGHYHATSWKGAQKSGGIASPQQSGVVGRLEQEAKQNGIVFNNGRPGVMPSGMPVLTPGMIHG